MTKVSKEYLGFSRESVSRRGRWSASWPEPRSTRGWPADWRGVRSRCGCVRRRSRGRGSRRLAGTAFGSSSASAPSRWSKEPCPLSEALRRRSEPRAVVRGDRTSSVGRYPHRWRDRRQGLVHDDRELHRPPEEAAERASMSERKRPSSRLRVKLFGTDDQQDVLVQGHRFAGVQPAAQLGRRRRVHVLPGELCGFGRAVRGFGHSFSAAVPGMPTGLRPAGPRAVDGAPRLVVACDQMGLAPSPSSRRYPHVVHSRWSIDRPVVRARCKWWRPGEAKRDASNLRVRCKRSRTHLPGHSRRVGWTPGLARLTNGTA